MIAYESLGIGSDHAGEGTRGASGGSALRQGSSALDTRDPDERPIALFLAGPEWQKPWF